MPLKNELIDPDKKCHFLQGPQFERGEIYCREDLRVFLRMGYRTLLKMAREIGITPVRTTYGLMFTKDETRRMIEERARRLGRRQQREIEKLQRQNDIITDCDPRLITPLVERKPAFASPKGRAPRRFAREPEPDPQE